MLTPEENEALCLVGPDTPMGTLLRRYWVPAFQLSDLPEPDCAPIRVTILGENFVAFRDTEGRLGVLDELCCHRGASLVLGRVEDCGIRCLYHGWKYAVDGTIMETPNLTGSRFRERVKHGSYPVRESGGLAWVYLGPPDTEPPLPRFRWDGADEDELMVSEMIMDCNFMQVLEGSIDSSHVGVLHLDTLAVMGAGPRSVGSYDFPGDPWDHDMPTPPRGDNPWPSHDNAPRIEVEDTPFGFHYAALRESADDPGNQYVRVTAFVMPYTAFVGGANGAVIVVPRDDHTCSSFGVSLVPKGMGGPGKGRRGVDPSIWGPEPENRRMRIPAQDREAMKSGQSFAGFKGGNRVQDGAVQMSSGPLYDRAKEHLVPADLAIIRLRRLLADSIQLVAEGKPPLGLGEGFDYSGIAAASATVDAQTPWQDLVPGNLAAHDDAAPAGR